MKYFFIVLIKLYQFSLSPFIGHHCRFIPTCSEYAKQAFLLHGTRKGAILTVKRILRCHPWAKGGLDPVPLPVNKEENYGRK